MAVIVQVVIICTDSSGAVFHMSAMAARNRIALLACVLLCAAGCATAPEGGKRQVPAHEAAPSVAATKADSGLTARPARSVGEQAAYIASRQVGVPYRYGGSGRSGFDCSGLVYYAYGQLGVSLPRTTAALWTSLDPVADAAIRVGDVLFFDIDGKASHVGMYLGEGRFVHAPSSGRHVTVARLDRGFYREAFIRAGRP